MWSSSCLFSPSSRREVVRLLLRDSDGRGTRRRREPVLRVVGANADEGSLAKPAKPDTAVCGPGPGILDCSCGRGVVSAAKAIPPAPRPLGAAGVRNWAPPATADLEVCPRGSIGECEQRSTPVGFAPWALQVPTAALFSHLRDVGIRSQGSTVGRSATDATASAWPHGRWTTFPFRPTRRLTGVEPSRPLRLPLGHIANGGRNSR